MRNCLHCGKETHNKKFCSLSCSAKSDNAKNARQPPKPKLTVECIQCGDITTNPRFCSHSCSAIYNNTKPTKYCLYCGKPINKTAKSYCSIQCSWDHEFQQRLQTIKLQGYIHDSTRYTTHSSDKRIMIALYGNKCNVCGQLSSWNEQHLVLVLDHINGIANDWRLENLQLVCPNCDSQLPTFKNRNRNGVRKYRKKYS